MLPMTLGDIKKGNGHIVAAHLKETVEDVFRDMELRTRES